MPKLLMATILTMMFSIVVSIAKSTLFPPNYEHISYELSVMELEEIKTKSSELPELELKDHDAFLFDIGMRESSNNYKIVNKFGYMGKYQFGKQTLKAIGIKTTKQEFLNNPELQEEAMRLLLIDNKKRLQKYIDKYEGTYLHGVYITESGVLAGAHLAGVGNVRKFFRKGWEFKDGKGTKMTSYMKKFSGYSLDI